MGAAKIRREMQRRLSMPLPPQRDARPSDKDLYIYGKMTPVRSVGQVPPWATEKPAPHFGKASGLPSGSWKQSEIMERISETWGLFSFSPVLFSGSAHCDLEGGPHPFHPEREYKILA